MTVSNLCRQHLMFRRAKINQLENIVSFFLGWSKDSNAESSHSLAIYVVVSFVEGRKLFSSSIPFTMRICIFHFLVLDWYNYWRYKSISCCSTFQNIPIRCGGDLSRDLNSPRILFISCWACLQHFNMNMYRMDCDFKWIASCKMDIYYTEYMWNV